MARRVMMLFAIASVGVLALAFAGCGSSKESAATTETAVTTTTETTTEATTEATDTTATDTTATDTTATDTTATETTDTSGIPDFASSENCKQFAEIGTKISSSLSGSGTGNLDDVQKAFDQYAAAAPADIRDDFQTLADWFGQVAGALGSLKAGQTPSAADLAKLQSIDSTAATQASQNISTWVQQNCTG